MARQPLTAGSYSGHSPSYNDGAWIKPALQRLVEADLWERDFLDLVGPAMLTIRTDGTGEIAFGAVQAGLDIGCAPSIVLFTWAGFDDMDEVTRGGSAELLDDGSLEI